MLEPSGFDTVTMRGRLCSIFLRIGRLYSSVRFLASSSEDDDDLSEDEVSLSEEDEVSSEYHEESSEDDEVSLSEDDEVSSEDDDDEFEDSCRSTSSSSLASLGMETNTSIFSPFKHLVRVTSVLVSSSILLISKGNSLEISSACFKMKKKHGTNDDNCSEN